MITIVSQFLYYAANEDSWVYIFMCSGPSGLAFEEKKRRIVFFDAVKDSMLGLRTLGSEQVNVDSKA